MPSSKLSDIFPDLSRLGLGTVQFGMNYGFKVQSSPARVAELLNECFRQGINFLDTARDYGESEKVIGDFLCAANNHSFYIATKLVFIAKDEKGFIRQRMRDSINISKRMLHLDRIPMLLLHQTDANVANVNIAESDNFWEVLEEFKDEYSSFGLSVYDSAKTEMILQKRAHKIDFIQAPYNVFNQEFKTIAPLLKKERIGFVARSVFLKGVVGAENGKHAENYYRLPDQLSEIRPNIKKLDDLAEGVGLSRAEAALLFVAKEEWIDHIVFGAVNVNEIKENIAALKKQDLFDSISSAVHELVINSPDQKHLTDPRQWDFLR